MKKKMTAKKFRMRIGAMLLMVLIMIVGSCLNDLRFFALAPDANGALAETGQKVETPQPSQEFVPGSEPTPGTTPGALVTPEASITPEVSTTPEA